MCIPMRLIQCCLLVLALLSLTNGQCSVGCSCPDTVTCSSCINTYYQVSSGLCQPCFQNCIQCQLTNNNQVYCSQCANLFYPSQTNPFQGNTCVACSAGCQACNSNGCFSCLSGYYTLNGGNTCLQCPQLPNCIQCGNTAGCSTCFNGYYVASNAKCVLCQTNCHLCNLNINNNQLVCTTCSPGYFVDPTNSSNCISCSGLPTNCQTCVANQGVSSNKKIAASCLSCEPGFYLTSAFECQACPTNCVLCSDGDSCDLTIYNGLEIGITVVVGLLLIAVIVALVCFMKKKDSFQLNTSQSGGNSEKNEVLMT